MASTPIYSWPTPDNTDLVKNGALAIRTLGDAIDTTVDTMIPETIFAAKGDLLGASANDTPAVLTVGANGETLVADSSTSTGLRYQGAMAAGRNGVINGGFDNWQRGTSVAGTTGNPYTADRWQAGRSGVAGYTVSRQVTGDTTNLPFVQYCARVQRDSGNSSTNQLYLGSSFESFNAIPYAGKSVTLSFYARAGANYSASSSNLVATLFSGTGTDQSWMTTGYTGQATVGTATNAITTTWTRYSITGTVASTATELAVIFNYTPVGTAGADDYFEVTGVQVEVGSVATQFSRAGATIQGELSACQRYYYRFTGDGAFQNYGVGMAQIATSARIWVVNPVTMRVKPTSLDYGNLLLSQIDAGYSITALTIQTDTSGKNGVSLSATVASGLTTYRTYFLYNDNNTAGYVGLSAEL
jgi:hypothetical protein